MADKLQKPRFAKLPIWPNARIFGPSISPVPQADDGKPASQRCALSVAAEGVEYWFTVTSIQTDHGVLHFAASADAAVRAEKMQKEFLQTLIKTFAELSVGMAIFQNSGN